MSQVFTQDSTVAVNASWAILADAAFEQEIGDLCQILSLGLSNAEERPNYIAEYINKARKAVQDAIQEDVEDAATKDKLHENALEQKLLVLQEIAQDVQSKGLPASAAQQELEGFANLLIALLVQCRAPQATFQAVLPPITSALTSATSLQTLLHLLPATACPSKTRLDIYVKSIHAIESVDARSKAILQAPVFLKINSAGTAETDAVLKNLVDLCLESDDEETSLDLLISAGGLQAISSQTLKRTFLRLAISKPTFFDFDPAAISSLPEASIVAYILSESSNLDDGLLTAEAPVISRDHVEVKKSALAISKLFADKVGMKVAYSDILPIVPSSPTTGQDQDTLIESAVIDAIKSKLVQTRLSQPKQQATVVSSRYQSLPFVSAQSDSLAQWKLIQAKIEALKQSLSSVAAGIDSAVGGTQVGQSDVVQVNGH